jgi:V8-like Glu-specific endopeptidase
MTILGPGLILATALLGSAPALAASPDDADPRIYGGQPASVCQWPTAVAMVGGGAICSGTLVHPEVVVYAAHCSLPTAVSFGESALHVGLARSIPVDHCLRYVEEDEISPDDYAYCKLSEPVTDVPITPPVYGCELDVLVDGAQVTIAGYGETEMGDSGTKFWATTTIAAMEDGTSMMLVGGDGTSAYFGDSGGPAYIQHPQDRTWHAFGIVSGGMQPGDPGRYVKMWTAVPWIEEHSGVDITPCHDTDGSWAPTDQCRGFATNPASTGDWTNGCQDGDEPSGWSATCGPPAVEDEEAPIVTITSPTQGSSYPGPMSQVDVTVDASDDPAGIGRVWIRVEAEGMDPIDFEDDADHVAPYEFEGAVFPEGAYLITAIAEDTAGNVAESEPVGIAVGDVEPPEVDEGGTGGVDAGAQEDDEVGCGCKAAPRSANFGVFLLGVIALGRRRRCG